MTFHVSNCVVEILKMIGVLCTQLQPFYAVSFSESTEHLTSKKLFLFRYIKLWFQKLRQSNHLLLLKTLVGVYMYICSCMYMHMWASTCITQHKFKVQILPIVQFKGIF